MKKLLKIIAGLVGLTVVVVAAVFLYWNRAQQIDFTSLLPQELKRCGNTIGREDKEYIELKNWFKSNQQGWKNTPVTYVPQNTYTSATIAINVLEKFVVINYQDVNGSWRQVVRQKTTNELVNACTKIDKAN